MAYKRITAMDSYEIIRRWHSGQNNTQISTALALDRKTVRAYIKRAQELGLSQGAPLPTKPELLALLASVVPKKSHPQPARTTFEPFKKEIIAFITAKVDPLKSKTAFEIISERYGIKASYSSFKRFVRSIPELRTPQRTTCRFEVEPAEEIQIDYGKMGRLYDPLSCRNRDIFAFVASASHSRFKYVEFSYKQDQRSFVSSHIRMFEFFGGVPKRIIIDNLKAGILKPDLYEPQLNRTYQEMAEHYGVFIDPARPYHPKDKGKVERAVPTVREQFRKLKALNENLDISCANRQIRTWCLDIDGKRIHGTTGLKPYDLFEEVEKPTLSPLPIEHFEIATWKRARVHVDQYIQFDKAFYSVPNQFVGSDLWVKGTEKLIVIYDDDHQCIKTHLRSKLKRHTDPNDFPKNFQVMMQDHHVRSLVYRSERVGEQFKQLITDILTPHAKLNTRRALAILRLVDKYNQTQLEEAAKVAVIHKLYSPKQLETLIQKMQTQHTEENILISEATQQFIRKADYFITHNSGGNS